MDENKNPESRYDVDEEEGATTVLRAMDAETEDEEEGADDGIARRRYDT